jgi:hypothetical protein
MFLGDQRRGLEPADATVISYTLLRHLGLMLDELSAQGLMLWQDDLLRWRWGWMKTGQQSERGFWALGEAIVDAVVTRFPASFNTQAQEDWWAAQEGSEHLSRHAAQSGASAFLPPVGGSEPTRC